jgi:PTH2 family peptidyl-tRNA hydrolase
VSNENQEVKMIIIMRKDLNMRKGKMVAQGSHAAVGLALMCDNQKDPVFQEWLRSSFKKICVGVNSEQELRDILIKADTEFNLPTKLITDAGHTEFNGTPTVTCGAILGYSDKLTFITGHLSLL